MKISRPRVFHRWFVMVSLCASLPLLSGCELYDWLVGEIQTAFSTAESYQVSVVDCKAVGEPGSILTFESTLSKQLSSSIREGIVDLGQLPKFRNIRLVDKIPESEFSVFHDAFFAKAKNYAQRIKLLREYCEKYKTNILMWGATMGDDYKIAFIGYLYRRDLDVIAETEPLLMTEKMSERVQENLVREASTGLLKKSLEGKPIGPDGQIANTLHDNKEAILDVSTYLMQVLLIAGGL
jgi:hypothetical protein